MQTHYFSPKASKNMHKYASKYVNMHLNMHKYASKYVNMHTQIHAKTHESHSSIVSKVDAFTMNSLFGYFNQLNFSMFYLLILLEPIIDYYFRSFSISTD